MTTLTFDEILILIGLCEFELNRLLRGQTDADSDDISKLKNLIAKLKTMRGEALKEQRF